MKLEIRIKGYIGNQWFFKENIYTIGYAFVNNHYYDNIALNELFSRINNINQFSNLLAEIFGEFSVIINKVDLQCLAVNHTRKFPLLFSEKSNTVFVQDYIEETNDLNNEQVVIFKQLFTSDGNATIFNNWQTLLSNQFAYITDNQFIIEQYRNYFKSVKKEFTFDEIDHTLSKVFERYDRLLKDNHIYITLSGGYDSRLVLCKLIEYYPKEKITCITYGNPDSIDVKTAKAIVKKLSLKHIFIEYNKDTFSTFFSEHFKNYVLNNHFGTQISTEQNYYALHYLKSNQLIPQDSVFINGIFGDGVAGEALDTNIIKDIRAYILKKHNVSSNSKFKLSDNLDNYENWHAQNRMFKFLSCANATFESFGYKVISPLGDNEWIALWTSMSKNNRLHANMYKKYIFNNFFIPLDIAFIKDESIKYSKLKNKLKDKLPKYIQYVLKKMKSKITKQHSLCNYDILYDMVYNHMNVKPNKDYNFNHIFALYMLELIEEQKQINIKQSF